MTIASAAARLNLCCGRKVPSVRRLPPLFLMSDEDRLPDPLAVLDALPAGTGVILRHYAAGLETTERHALALALRRATRHRGLKLLIAGSGRLAADVHADGLHLPEWQLARGGIAALWRRRRPGWIITAACHSAIALRKAAMAGADAALLAPVFATRSHPGTRGIGSVRFASLAARQSPVPVYALGGVDAVTVRRLAGIPVAGIAGIGGIGGPQGRHRPRT